MLKWVREQAPIIVHLRASELLPYFEQDPRLKNQFETQTSCGLLNLSVRKKWEHDLFSGYYEGHPESFRPKYGVLNILNDPCGVASCRQYGPDYIVLKDSR